MSDQLIAAQNLNPELRNVLSSLLDALIPVSEEFGAPSAGEDVIVEDFIKSMKGNTSQLFTGLLEVLQQESGGRFTSLSQTERLELFESLQGEHRGVVRALGSALLHVYYRNDQVLESLGMEARAPYPLGNQVEQGDHSLLDPVRNRGTIYRAV